MNKSKKDFHSSNIISLIIGSLLNNSYLEKRELGLSVRIIFIKSNSNVEYLSWFHKYLASNGYCSQNKLRLYKSIGKGNKVLYSYCLKTYSFTRFVLLYNWFYKNNVKIIPRNLYKYLTPLALATWFLSGTESSKKFEVYMKSSITIKDLRYLAWILKKKYNIYSVIVLKKNTSSTHTVNKCYNNLIGFLQIKESSRPIFSNIVKPHILPSLHYRLNEPNLRLGVPLISKAKYSTSSVSANNDLSTIKKSAKYKKEYKLSIEQKEALIGIILGDGSLERSKSSHNTRLRIEQAYPEKEGYLRSLYDLLEPMASMVPTILSRKDKRNGTITQSLYFRTLAMPCLNFYYELFYVNKVKIIPKNLGELLTARGLAKTHSFTFQ